MKSTRQATPPRFAYTLVEALVVFAVMLTILGLALVSVQAAREKSNRVTCQAQMANLVLAVHLHHDAKKTMPPYASGKGSEIYGSWFVHLLPYMGYLDSYDKLTKGQHTTSSGFQLIGSGHAAVHGIVFRELRCASDPSHGSSLNPRTNYLANWYAFSDSQKGAYRPAQSFHDLADGLSNVVLFAEGYGDCAKLPRLAMQSYPYHNFGITQTGLPSDDPSLAPDDYTMFQIKPSECDKLRTQTAHSAMPVALADGTSRFIEAAITVETWKRILKPRDGNPDHDW
jgi:hypothetical protein